MLRLLEEAAKNKIPLRRYNSFPYQDRTNVLDLLSKLREKGVFSDKNVWKIDMDSVENRSYPDNEHDSD